MLMSEDDHYNAVNGCEINCENKVMNVGEGIAGQIRTLMNAKGINLDCARVLHKSYVTFRL